MKKENLEEYLGKEFIINKNIFWSSECIKLIVKNFAISPGDAVLDLCTGFGVIVIFAAYKGAEKVIAVDINPEAVENAKENIRLHEFENIIEARISNMFSAIKSDETFDVIILNLLSDKLEFYKLFFKDAGKYLRPRGKIYISQANFGIIKEMKQTATEAGFTYKKIGINKIKGTEKIFYAFELKKE